MALDKHAQRFYDNSGVQFMKNGEVRCQATSAAGTRRIREERDDWDSPKESFWPDNQCPVIAVEGTFLCRYHGGTRQERYKEAGSYLDAFPTDMALKMKTLEENADYISRANDIMLMEARMMQLGERLRSGEDTAEAWGDVADALAALNRGDFMVAKELLERSLGYHDVEKATWREIHKTEKTLAMLTNTQTKTAKELRLMASFEQVSRLMATIYDVIQNAADKYITDGRQRTEFGNHITFKFAQLIGNGPTGFGRQIKQLDTGDD